MLNEKQTHLEQAPQTQGALSREHCCSALEDRIHRTRTPKAEFAGVLGPMLCHHHFKTLYFEEGPHILQGASEVCGAK